MTTYYNEIGPYSAQWQRNLIAKGHIAAGGLDERSIEDDRQQDISCSVQGSLNRSSR
jgi:DNA (cytosine-5)-methyltransferase 1